MTCAAKPHVIQHRTTAVTNDQSARFQMIEYEYNKQLETILDYNHRSLVCNACARVSLTCAEISLPEFINRLTAATGTFRVIN